MSTGDGEIKANRAVWGILAELPERTAPISNAKFMQTMRDIKMRHPELFPGMVFSDNTSVCWSTVLEQILFVMGASGCLHRSPVDMRWHFQSVNRGFKEVYAHHFSLEELAILSSEGQALAEKVAQGQLSP